MWMQDGCKSLHGFLRGSQWIMFHGHLDYFRKPPLGGRPSIKPCDHGTLNVYNRWIVLFYRMWGSTWIKIHWNSIWVRAQSHVTLHYTRGPVTTLYGFGGVLRWPWDTFFWALAIHGHGSWLVCEVALSARWSQNLKSICNYFLCKLNWSSYEYHIHCQSEDSIIII